MKDDLRLVFPRVKTELHEPPIPRTLCPLMFSNYTVMYNCFYSYKNNLYLWKRILKNVKLRRIWSKKITISLSRTS